MMLLYRMSARMGRPRLVGGLAPREARAFRDRPRSLLTPRPRDKDAKNRYPSAHNLLCSAAGSVDCRAVARKPTVKGEIIDMAIDLRDYQKYSGRSGDPYTRLGEALAKNAKA